MKNKENRLKYLLINYNHIRLPRNLFFQEELAFNLEYPSYVQYS